MVLIKPVSFHRHPQVEMAGMTCAKTRRQAVQASGHGTAWAWMSTLYRSLSLGAGHGSGPRPQEFGSEAVSLVLDDPTA
ncbi:hypothetical protein F9C11_20685 [Amycolatopsis sp. VS8301801F10]|uniref:hypothetical protein n=1 Tax=Amycolatopsis sp. VS8301801F10 TaxID=2652442 RepID=UPI0038FC9E0E